jgi:hypothetical protein
MAKSLRAHCKRRARTAMRETVGTRIADKIMRKTTRSTFRGLLASGSSEDELRGMLSGADGASARLVTLEPRKTRALPYTFNTELRAARIGAEIEDLTDDEAAEVEDGAKNERGELLHSEPVPTGERTFGTEPIFSGMAASDDDGTGGGADGPVVSGAALRAFDKPVGKRDMSASYHAWTKLDKINPYKAGFYGSEVPLGKNKKNKKVEENPFRPKPKGKGVF